MKTKKVLLFTLITLLGGYFIYDGLLRFIYIVFDLINGITSHIMFVVPFFISGILYFINLYFYLKHYFIKEQSKTKTLVHSSISLFLSVVFFVLYFISIGILFSNLKYNGDLIVIFAPLMVLALMALNVLNLVKRDLVLRDVELRELENMPKSRYIVAIIVSIFAFYMLGCIYVSFLSIQNLAIDFIGYLVLILFFCIYLFNEVYLFTKDMFIPKVKLYNLTLNAVMIVLFVVHELIYNNFIVKVGKPFAPLDFAASIPALPVILILTSLGFIIYDVVGLIHDKKTSKREVQ